VIKDIVRTPTFLRSLKPTHLWSCERACCTLDVQSQKELMLWRVSSHLLAPPCKWQWLTIVDI